MLRAWSNAPELGRSGETCQFTRALRLFRGSTRTFLEAGFALNTIFSFVKGLMPSRAFVAGFFTTFILRRPGSVNRPGPRRLFLMMPLSDSNTAATCLRDSSLSLQIVATISDFVGAPPFFAIFKFLVRKNAAENIFRGELFGAQHITQVRIRKHFRCTGMRQMPCFLGPRAHAATRGESQRAKNPRA